MSIRDEFKKWFKSTYTSPDFVARYDEYFTLNVYGEFVDWVEALFRVWQACAAHYEAERNSMLAVIAEKDAALRIFDRDLTYINCQVTNGINWDDVQSARKALSIHPDNCSKGK